MVLKHLCLAKGAWTPELAHESFFIKRQEHFCIKPRRRSRRTGSFPLVRFEVVAPIEYKPTVVTQIL